jgi:hypothetical protein
MGWLHANRLAGTFAGKPAATPSAARLALACKTFYAHRVGLTLTGVNSPITDPRV